jgi:stage II sporulation protein D
LNRYAASVVSGELANAHPKAWIVQSILARTYAINRIKRQSAENYHISDLSYHQVYLGWSPLADKIFQETNNFQNAVLVKDQNLVEAVFHAECGSRFYQAAEIWGRQQYDPSFDSKLPVEMTPGDVWEVNIPRDSLTDIFETEEPIVSSNNNGAIGYNVGGKWLSVDEFRLKIDRRLGWNTLPSNEFNITSGKDEIVFKGRGRGHLVGACQNQMNELAKSQWTVGELVELFYPGSFIEYY